MEYDLVLLMDDHGDNLQKRVNEINALDPAPNNVIFVDYVGCQPDFYDRPAPTLQVKVKSSIEIVMDPNATTDFLLLNYAFPRVRSRDFFVFHSSYPIEQNYLQEVVRKIKEGQRVVLIKSDNLHGSFFNSIIYKSVAGTSQTNVYDKIEIIANEHNLGHMVWSVDDVRPAQSISN